jgi:hypothetical protein
MLKLQFLICAPKTFGPIRKLHQNLGGTTTLNHRLNCQSYVCKDYAEFAKMNKDIVAKLSRSLWTAVQVIDTETGVTTDPAENLACVSEAFLSTLKKTLLKKSPLGADDGRGTVPLSDTVVTREPIIPPDPLAGALVGGQSGNTAGAGSPPSPAPAAPINKQPPPLPGEAAAKRVRNRAKATK